MSKRRQFGTVGQDYRDTLQDTQQDTLQDTQQDGIMLKHEYAYLVLIHKDTQQDTLPSTLSDATEGLLLRTLADTLPSITHKAHFS